MYQLRSWIPPEYDLIVIGTICFLAVAVAAIYFRRVQANSSHRKILLDAALENMSQGLCMYDAEGRVVLFNECYRKMVGLPVCSLKGRTLLDLLVQRESAGEFSGDPESYFAQLIAKVRERKLNSTVLEIPSGRTLRVVDKPMRGGGWVTTVEDLTDWQQAQAQIAHMARHDELTDLPNRKLFHEELEQALHRVAHKIAVLCIDLDNFTEVNDFLGHPLGDVLLKEVANRLLGCVRREDIVCRLGGDEFAIVHASRESPKPEVSLLASRIVEILSAPYDIEGHEVIIGTSIGISVAPDDATDADQLLKNADLALYLAKADGGSTYRFFETEMDARAQARRLLMLDLRAALARGEFELYYQPIYDLRLDRIVRFEALIRWNHPLRGLISPAEFIPIAEETGLIVQIGDWVLQKACMDAAKWSRDVSVAVNLSPTQFKNRNLVASVFSALAASGLGPSRLELEITESVLLQGTEATLSALHRLHDSNIRISMDDFGTGYSSLSYLRSFPFDKIKIDQSFVRELASRESMAIVRAVAALGKSLGIVTIAEGVETNEQLALLRSEGCTQGQGYLFNAPRPAAEVENMLSERRFRVVA